MGIARTVEGSEYLPEILFVNTDPGIGYTDLHLHILIIDLIGTHIKIHTSRMGILDRIRTSTLRL